MDKKSLKIVTIGGGSSYTPELVEGLIKRYDEMPVSDYWLVDIEEGWCISKKNGRKSWSTNEYPFNFR